MHADSVWDPQQYLRHANHRTRPFHDLLARVPDLPTGGRPPRIADLGCGPGNVTTLLADRWPTAHITGLDNSEEMLAVASDYAGRTAGGGSVAFAVADAAQWRPERPYDLIVSNAALQWVPGHAELFEDWIANLPAGGVLAFQMPRNFTAPSHALLGELCDTPRWKERLDGRGRRFAHVLEASAYLERLVELGCEVDAWETVYVQLLSGPDPVLDWVMGTGLRPVLTALADDPAARAEFVEEYRDELRKAYPAGPHGTVFPFRRVFAVARKPAD